ncbi:MAG: hypothetical protein Q8O95_01270 [bacterium]|nr:hypothetical protein [bacterium]
MKKLLTTLGIGILMITSFASSELVLAQPAPEQPVPAQTAPPITGTEFQFGGNITLSSFISDILPSIANWMAGFLAAIAVLVLIYAGIQYLTAEGEPEKISAATKTAFYTLGGLLLLMFGYAIVYLFLSIFTP